MERTLKNLRNLILKSLNALVGERTKTIEKTNIPTNQTRDCFSFMHLDMQKIGVLCCVFATNLYAAPADTGDKRNLALSGTATQSSAYQGKTAERAIDGVRKQDYASNSVSHTGLESEAWWQVKLIKNEPVKKVGLFFRSDNCCLQRNASFNLYLADFDMSGLSNVQLQANSNVAHYAFSNNSATNLTQDLNVNAQYVMVKLAGSNYLSLAEVEVFSDEVLPVLPVNDFLDKNRYGAFLHYNMSTYTNVQWANPNADPSLFAPSNLDTDQWAQVLKDAGMTYGVLTSKHHDGFALWDTDYSNHNSLNSACECNVVRQYVDSFRAKGIVPGIYFSIWDLNDPAINTQSYGSRPNDVSVDEFGLTNIGWTKRSQDPLFIKNQLRELLTEFGEIPLLWFDAWGQIAAYDYVPYQDLRDFIRHVSPQTIIVNNDKNHSNATADLVSIEDGITLHPNAPTIKGVKSQVSTKASSTWFAHADYYALTDANLLGRLLYETTISPNGTALFNLPVIQEGVIPNAVNGLLAEVKTIAQELSLASKTPSSKNVAIGKPTGQSSIYGQLASRFAVDGDASGVNRYLVDGQYANKGSLMHTESENNPWWIVDLGTSQYVDEVRIWNRSDCCEERLGKIAVAWSDSNITQSLWNNGSLTVNDNVQVLDAGSGARILSASIGGNARFIKVQKADAGYLSLGEVEVLRYNRNLTDGQTAFVSAYQSSTSFGGVANRAIDQNIDGNYAARSVTHTDHDVSAWWEVDLGAISTFDKIQVYNRQDCCKRRFTNMFVFVSSQPMEGKSLDQLQNDTNITQFHREVVGDVWNIDGALSGRYVRVQRAEPGYLSIAEVAIYQASEVNTNLALAKIATQSTTAYGGSADRAVDGNISGVFTDGSVTHTAADEVNPEPWWQVDLSQSQPIKKVSLYGRTDCCAERFTDMYVMFFDDPPNTDLSLIDNINAAKRVVSIAKPKSVEEIEIPTINARYVLIRKASSSPLSLAEVIVE